MARIASNRLGWVSEINGGGGTGFVQTNYEYDLGNYLDQIADGAFDVGPRRWVVIEGGNNDLSAPMDQRAAQRPQGGADRAAHASRTPRWCSSARSTPTPTTPTSGRWSS